MTSEEAELLWKRLGELDSALGELSGRVEALERRGEELIDRGDLLRLRDSIDALERSVLSVVEWERDSVVAQPKLSLSPASKIRLKLWEWIALAAAAAVVGAAGTAITVMARSCGVE